MADDSSSLISPWLTDFGWKVHELVLAPDAIEHFREMVRRWQIERVGQLAERDESDRRERERAYQRWRWRVLMIKSVVLPGPGPPYEDSPDDTLPLPLCKGRAPSQAAKYAILAAVHDCVAVGVESIDPWAGAESEGEDTSKRMLERVDYILLCDQVPEIPECDRQALEEMLRAIQSNIAANGDDPADASKHLRTTTTKSEQRAEWRDLWLAKAMLLVRDNPGWSDAEIARRVKVDRSTLSRSPEYQAATAMARGDKTDRSKGHVKVDSETGKTDVEAYIDDDPAERD